MPTIFRKPLFSPWVLTDNLLTWMHVILVLCKISGKVFCSLFCAFSFFVSFLKLERTDPTRASFKSVGLWQSFFFCRKGKIKACSF